MCTDAACCRAAQVEYAIEAIKLGSTAIGIQTADGVVLAVEKRVTSPLMEPDSIEKIVEIDSHIGVSRCCQSVPPLVRLLRSVFASFLACGLWLGLPLTHSLARVWWCLSCIFTPSHACGGVLTVIVGEERRLHAANAWCGRQIGGGHSVLR